VEYNFPAFGDFSGMVRADWTYTGKMTSQLRTTNINYREFGKYSSVNLRAGFQKDNLGVFLYVRNVLDKTGVNTITSATGVPDYYATTAPRTVGATITSKF
jgi:hypothetical protein